MAETSPNCEEMEIGRTAVPGSVCTPRQLNERNRESWLKQLELTDKLMSDEAVLWGAINYFESQQILKTPLKEQKSFEWALVEADKTIYGEARRLKEFRTALAKKGGAVAKTDALQKLIVEIVRQNVRITTPHLLLRLENHRGGPVISDIDEQSDVADGEAREIHFVDRGKMKSAVISGLKDRLSRAKKKVASEKKTASR